MSLSISCPQSQYDQAMPQSHTVDRRTALLRVEREHLQSHDMTLNVCITRLNITQSELNQSMR